MSKNKKKYVNGYIVFRYGGLVNGYVERVNQRLIVGARTEKEAINLCKNQLDKTARYKVHYRDKTQQVKIGTVAIYKRDNDPYVEIDGDIYINTDDYKIDFNPEDGYFYLKHKYVHRYARSERDVLWKVITRQQEYKQFWEYYLRAVEETLNRQV